MSASVLDQAQNIRGVVTAARQRERWQQREVKTSDPETREQLREAIADLEFRFPEIEDIPPGGAEAFARERGGGTKSRSPVHEGRRRTANKPSPAKPAKAPAPAKPKASKAAPTAPRPSRSPGGRRRPAVRRGGGRYTQRRLYAETGIPGAAWSATSITMSLLGATVGLSLLYLILSSSERRGSGAQALPQMLGAVTGFVRRFVSTDDVLGTGAAAAAAPVLPAYAAGIYSGELAGPADPRQLRELLPELKPIPKNKRAGQLKPIVPRRRPTHRPRR